MLLSVGGVVGFREYRSWQERRLIAQANALVNEGDYKRATLGAKRVLQLNPQSIAAVRIMARVAELGETRAAVDWRRRVVDLKGATAQDWLALARVAIRFEDAATAEFAISRVPAEARETAEYYAVLGERAFARRDAPEMERQFQEAVQRDPENKQYRLRLATVHLTASEFSVREQARRTLLELRSDRQFRREAMRKLIDHELRTGSNVEALALARELDGFEEKTFLDRLLLLSATRAAQDPALELLLQQVKEAAAGTPDYIAALVTWWNGNQMPAAAVEWSRTLKPDLLGQRGVPLALADSYMALRDWEGLQRFVKNANWGGLDYVRAALHSRALRELGNSSDAATQWAEASKKVSGRAEDAFRLAEMLEKWGWRNETIEIFWLASKDPAKGELALQSLYRYYAQKGDTGGLYRVMLRREETRPNDRDIQNNFAHLSLLLNLNAERGQRIARELHEADPLNPAYASTYAFALYVQGQPAKALAIFNKMPADHLRRPDIAAYYGVVLAASGDHSRAAEYLDLGEQATLLPEEKALLEKARRTIAQR